MAGLLFIVCGPSGVGKTTLCRRLLSERDTLKLSISYTTRAPRGAEQNGVAYHFVDEAKFVEKKDAGDFAEWAHVHGNYYGTSVEVIEQLWADGFDVLFDIDYQGAAQLKERFPSSVATLVIPPSMAELEQRLRGRGTDADDVVARRLAAARHELEQYAIFDFLLPNHDLDAASENLASIYDVSRFRIEVMRSEIERILQS